MATPNNPTPPPPRAISANPAIKARFLTLDTPLFYNKPVLDFKDVVISKLALAVEEIILEAPPDCDIGKFIKAIDSINSAKHDFIDSAMLGELKKNNNNYNVPWDSK